MGHTVIMGRKTFESIGKGLTGRRNLVVSRNPEFRPEGATRVPSLEAAFAEAGPTGEVFVIGGADIYRQAMPRRREDLPDPGARRPRGRRALSPPRRRTEWALVSTELRGADDKNEFSSEFRDLQRKGQDERLSRQPPVLVLVRRPNEVRKFRKKSIVLRSPIS